jgi:hypothetical protein
MQEMQETKAARTRSETEVAGAQSARHGHEDCQYFRISHPQWSCAQRQPLVQGEVEVVAGMGGIRGTKATGTRSVRHGH